MYFMDMELVVSYGDADGKDHRMFEAYRYQNGHKTLDKKGVFFYPPDTTDLDAAYLYGPGSTWKLDDPVWLESRHHQISGNK